MVSRCDVGRTSSIRRWFRLVATTATSLGLAAALMAGTGQTATADPPLTIAEAKARISQLETDASAIDQEYVDVKEQLDAGTSVLKRKQADVRAQTAQVRRLKFQVGQVALAQFQNRNLDTAAQLIVTPDTDEFLSQISTVEKVSENQNAVLQDYQQKQAELADTELSAKTDLAALAEQELQLKALRKASDTKIAESKSVLAKLTREQQRKIAEEERKAAEAAKNEAESGATGDGKSTSRPAEADDDDKVSAPSGSGRGARALAFARSQLGDPYRFAAAGPDAYDCSGLMFAAWKSVGVSLPRSSKAQSVGGGTSVSKSELEPGDLIFYYSPVSHVGMYAGNGQLIHAPKPGSSVRYTSLDSMPFAGAKRPG